MGGNLDVTGTVKIKHPTNSTYYGTIRSAGNLRIESAASRAIDFITGGSERVAITNTGDVGIGTTTPDYQLEIENDGSYANLGMTSYRSAATPHCTQYLRAARGSLASPLALTSGDDIFNISGYGYDGDSFVHSGGIKLASEGTIADNRIPTYMAFSTHADSASASPVERMVISSAGNMGLGVTPESWDSSYTALQFSGNGSVSGWGAQTGGASIQLSQNAYIDTGWKRITGNDEASQIDQVNGTIKFNVAPSGSTGDQNVIVVGRKWVITVAGSSASGNDFTALGSANNNVGTVFTCDVGGTISGAGRAEELVDWNTALTIDNSGNVGIGTSSPSAVLDVRRGDASGKIAEFHNSVGYGIEIGSSTADAYISSGYDQDFLFKTGTTTTTRMVISSTGNVGIGLGSGTPAARLHVASGIYESDTEIIRLGRNDSAVRYHSIYANASATPATSKIQFKIHDGVTTTSQATVLTLTGAGNMGLGVTPESWKVDDFIGFQIGSGASFYGRGSGDEDKSGMASHAYYDNANDRWQRISAGSAANYYQASGEHHFYVASAIAGGSGADSAIAWTNAMTIDNDGRVSVGMATGNIQSAYAMGVQIRTGTGGINIRAYDNTTNYPIRFSGTSNSVVGSITMTSSSVSYNTSSDYRLKENVVPMSGSIDRLKALKPSKFNFISDADTTVDGFLAHEAQAVVPEAVSGEKDAMMMEDYEVTPAVMDGETVVTEAVMGERSVPDMQGIDQAKLVPLLTSALQDAIAKIEQLESRITALEVN
jgi:hypothetical protein